MQVCQFLLEKPNNGENHITTPSIRAKLQLKWTFF